ncbi:unnamed protein product [Urochloa humidicola]
MASPKQQHQHQHRKRKGGGGARPLVLRRAMLHSCLCFVVGLVTGLAPSDWADAASRAAAANAQVLSTRAARAMNHTAALLTTHYQLRYYQPEAEQTKRKQQQEEQQVLVVVTTTTTTAQAPHQPDRERRSAGLTRTAHALRLVSPPLVVVWLVVEPAREAPPTAALLRRTGLVYRHLTYADNFTSCDEERHHQRNVALAHVEQHRLRGVLLFAGLADVYDLRLLDNLRHIRTLGAWPVATVWEQEGRVAVQGPLCTSSGNSSNTSVSVSAWFSAPTFSTSTSAQAAAACPRQTPPPSTPTPPASPSPATSSGTLPGGTASLPPSPTTPRIPSTSCTACCSRTTTKQGPYLITPPVRTSWPGVSTLRCSSY